MAFWALDEFRLNMKDAKHFEIQILSSRVTQSKAPRKKSTIWSKPINYDKKRPTKGFQSLKEIELSMKVIRNDNLDQLGLE